MERYHELGVLGRGSFGEVLLVREATPAPVEELPRAAERRPMHVVKVVNLSKATVEERRDAHKEAELLCSLAHPNVVTYRESFVREECLHIVMEYADGGDLGALVNRQRTAGRPLKELEALSVLLQCARGLEHVHERLVVHRDIKCPNVFLFSSGVVKLGDFGIAKSLEGTMALANTFVGTPSNLAPEVCSGKPYDFQADIWSLGVIFYEMLALEAPFRAATLAALVMKIISKEQCMEPLRHYSRECRDLVLRLLCKRPDDRPNASALLQARVLKRMEVCPCLAHLAAWPAVESLTPAEPEPYSDDDPGGLPMGRVASQGRPDTAAQRMAALSEALGCIEQEDTADRFAERTLLRTPEASPPPPTRVDTPQAPSMNGKALGPLVIRPLRGSRERSAEDSKPWLEQASHLGEVTKAATVVPRPRRLGKLPQRRRTTEDRSGGGEGQREICCVDLELGGRRLSPVCAVRPEVAEHLLSDETSDEADSLPRHRAPPRQVSDQTHSRPAAPLELAGRRLSPDVRGRRRHTKDCRVSPRASGSGEGRRRLPSLAHAPCVDLFERDPHGVGALPPVESTARHVSRGSGEELHTLLRKGCKRLPPMRAEQPVGPTTSSRSTSLGSMTAQTLRSSSKGSAGEPDTRSISKGSAGEFEQRSSSNGSAGESGKRSISKGPAAEFEEFGGSKRSSAKSSVVSRPSGLFTAGLMVMQH